VCTDCLTAAEQHRRKRGRKRRAQCQRVGWLEAANGKTIRKWVLGEQKLIQHYTAREQVIGGLPPFKAGVRGHVRQGACPRVCRLARGRGDVEVDERDVPVLAYKNVCWLHIAMYQAVRFEALKLVVLLVCERVACAQFFDPSIVWVDRHQRVEDLDYHRQRPDLVALRARVQRLAIDELRNQIPVRTVVVPPNGPHDVGVFMRRSADISRIAARPSADLKIFSARITPSRRSLAS
jgi:hypothetical protein